MERLEVGKELRQELFLGGKMESIPSIHSEQLINRIPVSSTPLPSSPLTPPPFSPPPLQRVGGQILVTLAVEFAVNLLWLVLVTS